MIFKIKYTYLFWNLIILFWFNCEILIPILIENDNFIIDNLLIICHKLAPAII